MDWSFNAVRASMAALSLALWIPITTPNTATMMAMTVLMAIAA
jgi:hypothetical protein